MIAETKSTSWERLRALRKAVQRKGFVRILEAHNGLSGIIAERARIVRGEEVVEYDGLWVSSLTESAARGLPDASIVSYDSRMLTIDQILNVTDKPVIVDGDTGGEPAQFEYLVRYLERRGVSGVIIEDKVFPKRNSLDVSAMQTLEDPAIFTNKIQVGKEATVTRDFLIIARLESLIAGTGLEDALDRAERYILAGVDGIMIHSKKQKPDEVLSFARDYERLCRKLGRRPVLVCVPTTYNSITDAELAAHGFNIIIYANHLLRAAYKAMTEAARKIMESGRGLEVEPLCASVKEIFSAVGLDRIAERDRQHSPAQRLCVVIPAAGKDPAFPEKPKSLLRVAGRRVLDFQLEEIRKAGLNRIAVVRGHEGDQFSEYDDENLIFCENPRYGETFDLYSIFRAGDHMGDGFVVLYSDILFGSQILKSLINTDKDIVLAVDHSYEYHRHEIDKKLDLAVRREKRNLYRRSLQPTMLTEISRIGRNIEVAEADFEFIGMAYFSRRGAEIARAVYQECLARCNGRFHDAERFEKASVTDLFQELIDRGIPVHGLEIYKGWLEIHNPQDIAIAERELIPSLSQSSTELLEGGLNG